MSGDAVAALLARYAAGALSPQIAAMRLLIETKDAAQGEARVARAAAAAESAARTRLEALLALLAANRAHAEGTVALLRQGVDHEAAPRSTEDGLAACRALFDRWARQQPEAGVALYSLGSPALLAACTEEIRAVLRDWGLLRRQRRVLDLGCGIGRVAAALAQEVASVVGIDLSPEMIAEARRRCAGQGNIELVLGSGRDLAPIAAASIDLVLAVDSFPYIVQAGMGLADAHVAEAARVLTPGGDLVILNFSYRGDADADRRDVARLAARHGFVMMREGVRPFALWDGVAFHLRKIGGEGKASLTRE